MDKKIIFGVALFAMLALAVGLIIPGGNQQRVQTFPWQIEVMQNGATRVFGLSLGESSLQQAEQVFGSITELSLFEPAPGKGQRVVEAYFDKVNLGGLSAKVVAVVAFTPEQLKTIFERGSRISTLGDGSRKVSLSTQDLVQARNTPIETITYLPGVRLDDALLEKRFGRPEQIITEKESATRHWLYPRLGLDIAVDEKNKAVLQYIAPAKFSELVRPLQ
jgi:hypothetical protein